MRSRAVRLTLTLLAFGALAAAAYLFWNIERRSAADVGTARTIDARIDAATRLVFELRAAQQAYVASGQSEQFWMSKAAVAARALQEALEGLRASPLPASAQAAIENAVQALQDFERMDRRARSYASSEQKLLASDLIFSDGLDATARAISALDEARAAQAEASSRAETAARRAQGSYAAGAAAIALVALVLLSPAPRRSEASALPTSAPVTAPTAGEDLELGAALDRSAAASRTPAAALEPIPELQDVADVCAQLARLADTSSLPALLQRTALALDASGVVLWVADAGGTELTPVAAHGYPESVLARMGAIERDSENATAAAFRTGLLQIVKADAMSHGAIAAPLVNQGGCIGVMSAEVRHAGETQPARLAIATIVAAQLATLVAPATRVENRAAL